jgi:hypothetical protein
MIREQTEQHRGGIDRSVMKHAGSTKRRMIDDGADLFLPCLKDCKETADLASVVTGKREELCI